MLGRGWLACEETNGHSTGCNHERAKDRSLIPADMFVGCCTFWTSDK